MADNSNPLPGLFQMMLSGVARHILTGIAGGLAAAGGLSTDQKTQFITGGTAVVVWLGGVAWSALNKKAAAMAVQQALYTPVPGTPPLKPGVPLLEQ